MCNELKLNHLYHFKNHSTEAIAHVKVIQLNEQSGVYKIIYLVDLPGFRTKNEVFIGNVNKEYLYNWIDLGLGRISIKQKLKEMLSS